MTWEFYEVWGVDHEGRESLIDTTKDLKEARELAETSLGMGDCFECIIYSESEDGDITEVERISN